jgi:hypothetical protein
MRKEMITMLMTVKRATVLVMLAAACAWTAAWTTPAAGAAPMSTIAGTVAAVGSGTVTVTTADGARKVADVGADTLILSRAPATLRSIRAGDALAVTAKREADGALTAVSISVFSPALWNRVRKGQWTMDSGNIMTNALVTQVVERVEGRTLHMKLAQGTKTITVPNGTVIHRLTTVGLSALKPGTHVTVRGAAGPDGTTRASSIVFDRPG